CPGTPVSCPGTELPYPGTELPYPGTERPCPGTEQAYPGTRRTYPGTEGEKSQVPGGSGRSCLGEMSRAIVPSGGARVRKQFRQRDDKRLGLADAQRQHLALAHDERRRIGAGRAVGVRVHVRRAIAL